MHLERWFLSSHIQGKGLWEDLKKRAFSIRGDEWTVGVVTPAYRDKKGWSMMPVVEVLVLYKPSISDHIPVYHTCQ